jgi:hypothetical protein
MSTLDATFATVYGPRQAAASSGRTTAARPEARETAPRRAGGRAADQAERIARRRQDATRQERDRRLSAHVERARDNAASRHPLGLR